MKCMGETRTHDVRWLFFWLVYSGAAQLRSRFPSTVSYLNQLFSFKEDAQKAKTVFCSGPPCFDPVGPFNGTRSCSIFGVTKFCQVTCDSGSRLYKESSLFWICGTNGVWNPSDVIPDCVGEILQNRNVP